MLTRSSFRLALVVGIIAVATTWFGTRAGDLNPPKGPIQPTMVSLEDLYNRISTQGGCPSCAWEYRYVSRDTLGGLIGQVVVGSGVLHAVVLPSNPRMGTPSIFDAVGQGMPDIQTTIYKCGTWTYDSPPVTVVLDARFEKGLFMGIFDNSAGNDSGVTLVYRLDP